MSRWSSFLELQRGEVRPVAHAFVVLGLLVGGHTVLETARDALFLAELPPEQLNVVYVILAALSFLVVAESTAMARRFGRRNALAGTLGVAAIAVVILHVLPQTPATVMALYVTSGLVGAALLPQFWLLTARTFTSAQGRRLFGPIASGGVIGAVVGAGGAAVFLTRFAVSSLLLVSAATFGVAAFILLAVKPQAGDAGKAPERDAAAERRLPAPSTADAATGRALARRVALMIGVSTAALLAADYLFKSTAAREIAPAELGSFFAKYYAVTNVASLVVQLFVASRLVRRLGVAAATGVMPFTMLLAAAASLVVSGALFPVLALKLVDGGLRHSVQRVATELLYLPMPVDERERTKSLVETVLTRVVQAAMAGALFALGALGLQSPRILAALVVALTAAWLAVAISLRVPYLDLFRRALARGTLDAGAGGGEIDVNAAEVLVESMANPDPDHVVAAMDVLEQRGRAKLIPALVLYHDAEVVLLRALEIFGRSSRADWFALGERLLVHPSEDVRMAAVRALGRRGRESVLEKAADGAVGCVQAYAAYHLARSQSTGPLLDDPRIQAVVAATGAAAPWSRRGLLAAIVDGPDPRAVPIVLALVERGVVGDAEVDVVHLARAMEALPDPRYVVHCVERLAKRQGREAVHAALAAHGAVGFAALQAVLDDPKAPRRQRVHAPWGIGVHATQAACDDLVARLSTERDGFVRFKVLRGLGHIVVTRDVDVDRMLLESHAQRELVEHLRLGTLRLAIAGQEPAPASALDDGRRALRFLVGLLRSKEEQSLERAFRLLKIANRREDIHRVHKAAVSTDRKARSDAGEFLDTLLGKRRQRDLRLLFRIVIDDPAPADRALRTAPWLGRVPRDHDGALARLIADGDARISALASAYALALGGDHRAAAQSARLSRPTLDGVLGAAVVGLEPGAGA